MMMTEERSPEPSLQVLPGFLVVSVPVFRPRNLESPNQHSISSELNSLDRREGRQTGWLAGGRVSVWMVEEMSCGHEKVIAISRLADQQRSRALVAKSTQSTSSEKGIASSWLHIHHHRMESRSLRNRH
jgi:hypothetical protein